MLTPPPDYDHAEIIPGLYVGAFPPASPFDWGADVVVSRVGPCLSGGSPKQAVDASSDHGGRSATG